MAMTPDHMTDEERRHLLYKVGQVFTPAAPVSQLRFFAGRTDEVVRLIQCYLEPGRNAIVFGERGVGKTSLANIMHEKLKIESWVREPCNTNDNFSTLWMRIFKQVPQVYKEDLESLSESGLTQVANAREYVQDEDNVQVDEVVNLITQVVQGWFVVLDEYDRLTDKTAKRLITDVIKGVADKGSKSTILIVGVAEDVDQLLADHPSIERNITQIRLPLMPEDELVEIVKTGLIELGMAAELRVITTIAALSQGYPHITHMLSGEACLVAVTDARWNVGFLDLMGCLKHCTDSLDHTLRVSYMAAVSSNRPDAKLKQTLLGCALAPIDEAGTFQANDVKLPLQRIYGHDVSLQSYIQHLGSFCEPARGPVLQRAGAKGRVRYRFINPMMRPFVAIRGLAEALVRPEDLELILSDRVEAR